jgi:hypothetical protein
MRALQPAEANDGNFAWADLDERIRLAPGDATRYDPAAFGLQRLERVFSPTASR